jgi:hypothetical protein
MTAKEMPKTKLGNVEISRFILGGNPFSGFSHQPGKDREMLEYYTVARIKETLHIAESLGVTTFFGRADQHIIRTLMEYYYEGGGIKWFAQTCPEMKDISRSVEDAVKGGAYGCYIHGGVMDNHLANGMLSKIPEEIALIKSFGLAAGIAGHNPQVFNWAEEYLDADFYMCSYYNPTPRDKCPEHPKGAEELFREEDRKMMTGLIETLSRPVVHYKVLAAGRNKPEEAFGFAAGVMRNYDAVCVGIYSKDSPDMLSKDIEIFMNSISN